MGEAVTALGLMSGTSLDGIDAAILTTDGARLVQPGLALTVDYEPEARALLTAATRAVRDAGPGAPLPAVAVEAERVLTRAHAAAIQRLLKEAGLTPADIRAVGFHGQTVLHAPDRGCTVQLGDGPLLARLTGIDVVYDFRSADVAAGGQGAPLAPAYHAALAAGLDAETPIAVLNLGGVANLTWIASGHEPIAFDTGPGNGLLDEWADAHLGVPFDRDGALARAGTIWPDVLGRLLDHPYFDAPPPKSLDRHDFSLAALRGLPAADGAATLAAFTAGAVGRAVEHLPAPPARWLVCGGGRHNPAVMTALRRRLGQVDPVEAVGWRGDSLEAEAFAYLAVRSLGGLPISFPDTTGVPTPTGGGRLATAEGAPAVIS
jgi:anhydro-N-acetylmuramic acid kinase